MKLFKKSASILLILIMVISLFPISAYAARNYIVIDQNIEHGVITVKNPTNLNSSVNDLYRVMLTAEPEEGYRLKEWDVHYKNGADIPVYDAGGTDNLYYFDIPKTSAKTKYIIIGAVFEQGVPYEVKISFSDFSGFGSSVKVDRTDCKYQAGETVTVTVNMEYGADYYRGGLDNSYYIKDGEYTEFRDFPECAKIDEYTYTFTMPESDINLICYFDYKKSRVTVEKHFVDPSVSEYERNLYPSSEPVPYFWDEEKNKWERCEFPLELYTTQRLRIETSNRDLYCVTGMTAVYNKNGETIKEDILDTSFGFGQNREVTGLLTMPGSDATIQYRLEKLLYVNCAGGGTGTVSPDISRALPGDTVKITPNPAANYACSGISVQDADGNNIDVKPDNSFIMPDTDVTVSGAFVPGYVENRWDGEKVVRELKPVSQNDTFDISAVTNNTLDNGKYYVVSGNQTFPSRLSVNGTANIILLNGAVLNAKCGIGVPSGSVLNIYAQEDGTGVLNAGYERGSDNAAIGGNFGNAGDINIHGGCIKAEVDGAGSGAAIGGGSGGAAGIVRIYGGDVTAISKSYGAGIGGGKNGQASCHSGEGIVIYGGKVTAKSSGGGAGIGGGYDADYSPGSIAIYGGDIETEGWGSSAGIGGGKKSRNGKIDIYGGSVKAVAAGSDSCGAGIGSGNTDQGSEINIHGGTVVSQSTGGAGIGAGCEGNGGEINISGGAVWANSSEGGAGIGGGREGNGGHVNISGGVVYATSAKFDYNPGAVDAVMKVLKNPKGYDSYEEGYGKAVVNTVMLGTAIIIDLVGSSEKSGSGIGGGDEGAGGYVVINGGSVMAMSSLPGASAIGHGDDNEAYGSLQIMGDAAVKAGQNEGSAVSQAKSDRVKSCFHNMFVLIEYPNHAEAASPSNTASVFGGADRIYVLITLLILMMAAAAFPLIKRYRVKQK